MESSWIQHPFLKGSSAWMECGDSAFIGDLQVGRGQIAQYICQPWTFLQCTCRSAGLCWHSSTPYFPEMPDLGNYCTCSTSLPGICKIALSYPSAAFSHQAARYTWLSGKGRSPKFLRQALVLCRVMHVHFFIQESLWLFLEGKNNTVNSQGNA